MKKLFFILFSILSISALAQRGIDPAQQFKKAPGESYHILSDNDGRFQIVPFTAEGSVTDTLLTNPRLNGTDLVFDRIYGGTFIDTKTVPLAQFDNYPVFVSDGTNNFDSNGLIDIGNGLKLDLINKRIEAGGSLEKDLNWNGNGENNFVATLMKNILIRGNQTISITKTDTLGELAIRADDDLVRMIGKDIDLKGIETAMVGSNKTSIFGNDTLLLAAATSDAVLKILTAKTSNNTAQNGAFLQMQNQSGVVDYSNYSLPINLTGASDGDVWTYDSSNNRMVFSPITPNGNVGDNWGSQIAVTDGLTVDGTGTVNDPIRVIQNSTGFYEMELKGPSGIEAFVEASDNTISYSRVENQAVITVPDGVDLEYAAIWLSRDDFTQEDFKIKIINQNTHYSTFSKFKGKLPKMSFVVTHTYDFPNSNQYWKYDEDAPPSSQRQIHRFENGETIAVFKNAKSNGTNDKFMLILHF